MILLSLALFCAGILAAEQPHLRIYKAETDETVCFSENPFFGGNLDGAKHEENGFEFLGHVLKVGDIGFVKLDPSSSQLIDLPPIKHLGHLQFVEDPTIIALTPAVSLNLFSEKVYSVNFGSLTVAFYKGSVKINAPMRKQYTFQTGNVISLVATIQGKLKINDRVFYSERTPVGQIVIDPRSGLVQAVSNSDGILVHNGNGPASFSIVFNKPQTCVAFVYFNKAIEVEISSLTTKTTLKRSKQWTTGQLYLKSAAVVNFAIHSSTLSMSDFGLILHFFSCESEKSRQATGNRRCVQEDEEIDGNRSQTLNLCPGFVNCLEKCEADWTICEKTRCYPCENLVSHLTIYLVSGGVGVSLLATGLGVLMRRRRSMVNIRAPIYTPVSEAQNEDMLAIENAAVTGMELVSLDIDNTNL